jgi:heme-degrading monooxygenase HmoA
MLYNWIMPFVSVTRLRLRSVRFLPFFAAYTLRSLSQVKKAPGFRGGSLLPDRSWTFWTMTTWDDQESMRRFMTSGSHRAAMPHLLDWCDEASVVHWNQPENALPSWSDADRRMRKSGRASKVRFPSAAHATLSYRTPRVTGGGLIRPASA